MQAGIEPPVRVCSAVPYLVQYICAAWGTRCLGMCEAGAHVPAPRRRLAAGPWPPQQINSAWSCNTTSCVNNNTTRQPLERAGGGNQNRVRPPDAAGAQGRPICDVGGPPRMVPTLQEPQRRRLLEAGQQVKVFAVEDDTVTDSGQGVRQERPDLATVLKLLLPPPLPLPPMCNDCATAGHVELFFGHSFWQKNA